MWEKHPLASSCTSPSWVQNPQPTCAPRLESNHGFSVYRRTLQPNESHRPGLKCSLKVQQLMDLLDEEEGMKECSACDSGPCIGAITLLENNPSPRTVWSRSPEGDSAESPQTGGSANCCWAEGGRERARGQSEVLGFVMGQTGAVCGGPQGWS